jgi:hypothetical protein
MPTAIVFLEFLRERGSTSLLGGTPVDLTAPNKTSDELPRQDDHDDMHDAIRDELHDELHDDLHEELHKEGAVAS